MKFCTKKHPRMYFSAMQKDTFGDIIHIIRIDSIYYL